MTSNEILRIENPGVLFPKDLDQARRKYLELSKIYHPDHGGDHEVFIHIQSLFFRYQEMIKNGTHHSQDKILLTAYDGTKYQIRYRREYKIEIGKMYVSETTVFFLIEKEYKDLVVNGIKNIEGIKYRDAEMKNEYQRYMPFLIKKFVTKDNRIGVVFRKTKDIYLLRDVLNYFSGKLMDRHVAWIMSTLQNICCFLAYNNINHNDISLDTYFISPEHHAGFLIGGWWYSTVGKEKLLALPKRTAGVLPNKLREEKRSDLKTNLRLIRLLGLELFGDSSGAKLKGGKDVPKPFLDWLKLPPSENAFVDYKLWQAVLTESFGPRKFVKMRVNDYVIYKEG